MYSKLFYNQEFNVLTIYRYQNQYSFYADSGNIVESPDIIHNVTRQQIQIRKISQARNRNSISLMISQWGMVVIAFPSIRNNFLTNRGQHGRMRGAVLYSVTYRNLILNNLKVDRFSNLDEFEFPV